MVAIITTAFITLDSNKYICKDNLTINHSHSFLTSYLTKQVLGLFSRALYIFLHVEQFHSFVC